MLRELADGWFPALDADTLDRIVAAAWLHSGGAGYGDRQATEGAALLRRLGLRAMRGERLQFDEAVEAELPSLRDPLPPPPRPEGFEAGRFARRARTSALSGRAVKQPAPEPAAPARAPFPPAREFARGPSASVPAAPPPPPPPPNPAARRTVVAPVASGAGRTAPVSGAGVRRAGTVAGLGLAGLIAIVLVVSALGGSDSKRVSLAVAPTPGNPAAFARVLGNKAAAQAERVVAARRAAARRRAQLIAHQRAVRRHRAAQRRHRAAVRRNRAAARRRRAAAARAAAASAAPPPAPAPAAPAPSSPPPAPAPEPAEAASEPATTVAVSRPAAPAPAPSSSGGGGSSSSGASPWGSEFGP